MIFVDKVFALRVLPFLFPIVWDTGKEEVNVYLDKKKQLRTVHSIKIYHAMGARNQVGIGLSYRPASLL
jgi:hypothetical protein